MIHLFILYVDKLYTTYLNYSIDTYYISEKKLHNIILRIK